MLMIAGPLKGSPMLGLQEMNLRLPARKEPLCFCSWCPVSLLSNTAHAYESQCLPSYRGLLPYCTMCYNLPSTYTELIPAAGTRNPDSSPERARQAPGLSPGHEPNLLGRQVLGTPRPGHVENEPELLRPRVGDGSAV